MSNAAILPVAVLRSRVAKFVICVKNDHYPTSLEVRKLYACLPDEDATKHGQVRVIDESEEDYLYPASYFREIVVTPELEQTLTGKS